MKYVSWKAKKSAYYCIKYIIIIIYILQQVPGMSSLLGANRLHSSDSNYDQITASYFSQVSRAALDKLVAIYRHDFLLFGYSWEKYYDYVFS